MADIFLSYARGDAPKAARIAGLLETSGHTVWWDRQLKAGSRFSAEIDRALRESGAVVVLWSTTSIESAWVQDEAGVGRDKGRLYPVLLENVAPPLGFRQYQAADFRGWSGRARPRNFGDLLTAIATAPAVEPATQPRHWRLPGRTAVIAGSTAVLLAASALAAWLLIPVTQPGTVLLTAGATGDPAASHIFARQVALDLARFHPASLNGLNIGDDTQFSGKTSYRAELALTKSKAPGVDLSLVVAGRPGASWSESIDSNAGSSDDLRQHAASSLTTVLSCASKVDGSPSKLTTADYRLFLSACSAVESEYSIVPPADSVATLRQVTASAPTFAPALALLALADANMMSGGDSDVTFSNDAKRALARARQLDGSLEEVSAAEALLRSFDRAPWTRGFAVLAQGLQRHPNSAMLLDLQSKYLASVGRMNEAADIARQARGFEPLSALSTARLIEALAYSNRIPAAYEQLAKAEDAWPDSAALENMRYSLNLRYGDPRQALSQLRMAGANDVGQAALDESWAKFLSARMDPSTEAIDGALQAFRDRYRRNPGDVSGYLQALGTFGRTSEAFEVASSPAAIIALQRSTEILFRPHMRSVLFDPRFIGVADKLGLLAFWQTSGRWPDFCSDPELPYDCKKVALQFRS